MKSKGKKTKKIRKTTYPTPVEHVKHRDKRVNIPTEELRDFVEEYEAAPTKMLYPRDLSLDPQLVWKGKDEQDSTPLEVPIVPIYIQEKIHPQAIVEEVRAQAKKALPDDQLGLFADFNGIKFEEMIEFYQHEQRWSNRMILGDSLLVMTSLAEKEGLKGKVQTIYFDPPYGIKFGSNWQVSTRKNKTSDRAEDLTRQPEQVKAFRDTWELGIHSYLSYLRDRFAVCRDLLTESGSVLVQMNSENSHLLRSVLDEIFGSDNFVADIVFRKKSLPLGAKYLETMHDNLLFYAKDKNQLKFHHTFEKGGVEIVGDHGPYALFPDGSYEKIDESEFQSASHPQGTNYYSLFALLAPSFSSNAVYDYRFQNQMFQSPNNGSWVVSADKLDRLRLANRLQPEGKNLRYRLIYTDFPYRKATNLWVNTQAAFKKAYVVQTAPTILERCIAMCTDPGDLVLDPTCGSGTSAYVAEQLGRRWITIDTSRVAIALARTRLMSGKFPYYILSDSEEGIKKEAELNGKALPIPFPKTENDIKKGFVYKRVPHITLKSIANNEDIDGIYAKSQEKLEPVRNELNKSLKQSWEEWEIPRDADEKWQEKVKQLHAEWSRLRKDRQKEIDESISRHADTEFLHNDPFEDSKRIRVTGPFTVESLSPHRVLSPADENFDGTVSEKEAKQEQDFVSMILDNLRKAGVQNTMKKERLKFDRLEPFAGVWIQAQGEYSENGKSKRVAVAIGPEHGTVGPDQVKEAAKEAVIGIGFDLLIVCGFAFDPHVSEEAKRYGKLTVLTARMNPDLAMGDELLKKTGAGNLFMVFGEPDMEVKKKDGKVVVTIKGLDVYDPTTGQIRSSSIEDIACWFIDTNYNEESFFVRHAYFLGGDEPYEKLKRALRAEVDESAWSALYSNKSRPFDLPKTGKIAVKVINHYGDEVLKVFEVK